VADSAASSSLFMDLGPEGEVKYSCSVYSVKPRVSTSGFNPFVIETVELGLIIKILLFVGAIFRSDNDRYM